MSLDTMRSQRTTPVGAQQQQRRVSASGSPSAPPPEPGMPTISVGFGTLQSWEFTQRVARGLACSTLVPPQYQLRIFNKRSDAWEDNPSAIPNCIIALNMANRLGADPLMVMQNLYIVEGRPSWSSQFVISAINSSGRFTSLQYRMSDEGEKDVEYTVSEWVTDDKGKNKKVNRPVKTKVRNKVCVAFAKDRATGEILEGPPVSMEMAVKEGWYGKNGSKWQTMEDLMIRYRAASFFGRLYAPELLMGLRTVEETQEIIDAEINDEGVWTPVQNSEGPEPEVIDQESDATGDGERTDGNPGTVTQQIAQGAEKSMATVSNDPRPAELAERQKPAQRQPAKQNAHAPVVDQIVANQTDDDPMLDPPEDDGQQTDMSNLFSE